MSNPKDDAELNEALTNHVIPVGDRVVHPKALGTTAIPEEIEEPEKPEEKLELGQNVEDFQIDVPPEDGI